MHPKDLSIKDYSYFLPEEKIAAYPLQNRDSSKLLIYNNGKISEDIYRNLDKHLPANSLLIFNDTKVIEARLLFQKPTGGIIEIFCLEPGKDYPDIATAMQQKGHVAWQCLIGGASKWKHGQILEKKIKVGNFEMNINAKYLGKNEDSFSIELAWTPEELSFAEILHYAGAIPLPPYIKRESEILDKEKYQTIYAHHDGSVAAPTAGLHFTNELFKKLESKNIQKDFVTLHVGAGTFKPVKSKTMEEHRMHAEWIDVRKETIENILQHLNDPIIAVGTTSLRTIESLYLLAVKLHTTNSDKIPELLQWDPYDLEIKNISASKALERLLDWMNEKKLERLITQTSIIIAPGYQPKIANGLITNFHLPQSTLLLLVAALIGKDWTKVYYYALENNFRFLSYGDGSLLWFP